MGIASLAVFPEGPEGPVSVGALVHAASIRRTIINNIAVEIDLFILIIPFKKIIFILSVRLKVGDDT